jgi:gas vesicle protein
MKTYATASIPKYLLYTFSLIRLEEICQENFVNLKAIRYSENQVVCKLYGSKEDIKEAIKGLYSEINEECKNNADLIKKTQKKIPEELKQYVEELNNHENYKKNFEKLADRYIRHCTLNDINPHPEVSEDFVL